MLSIASRHRRKKISEIKYIFTAIIIAIILFGIGAGVMLSQQTQDPRSQAVTGQIRGTDSCGLVKLAVYESPACKRLTSCPANVSPNNTTLQYDTTYALASNDGRDHQVLYRTFDGFNPVDGCSTGWTPDQHPSANVYDKYVDSTIAVKAGVIPSGRIQTILIKRRNPFGTACGTYQNDL